MTDITELVKRMRERSGQYDEYGWHSEIEIEAADALEAQAKEIEELRAAMRPIALWSFEAQVESPAIKELHDDILRVRAALNGGSDE
jgi:hypothetical protein